MCHRTVTARNLIVLDYFSNGFILENEVGSMNENLVGASEPPSKEGEGVYKGHEPFTPFRRSCLLQFDLLVLRRLEKMAPPQWGSLRVAAIKMHLKNYPGGGFMAESRYNKVNKSLLYIIYSPLIMYRACLEVPRNFGFLGEGGRARVSVNALKGFWLVVYLLVHMFFAIEFGKLFCFGFLKNFISRMLLKDF